MRPARSRIKRILSSTRAGLIVFAIAALGTVTALAAPRGVFSVPATTTPAAPRQPVRCCAVAPITPSSSSDLVINAALTRTKLVQGENGTIEVQFTVDPPAATDGQSAQRASDIVVVLDRSGSMSENNKLSFAKQAIRELVERLRAEDRFALISFDDRVITHQYLGSVNSTEKERIQSMINNLQPGGSTNISAGLEQAYAMLSGESSERSRKVILLSDGHANAGIVDQNGLSHLVRKQESTQAVLSTVGLGLGFNETLLAALADYGMGKYSYLERLDALAEILTAQLDDSRFVYAASSELQWFPTPGVSLIDAGGYPINPQHDGTNAVSIPTGQILSGKRKGFFLTFRVPTTEITEASLGTAVFHFRADNQQQQQTLASGQMAYAVLSPENRSEAVASIDNSLFKKNWVENNYGRMQLEMGSWIRQGNRKKAEETLAEYRSKLQQATAHSPALQGEASAEVADKLSKDEKALDDAFSGSVGEQEVKRNRAAKASLSSAYDSQRY